MVSTKRVHCAYCKKKCSGSVLRYQDRYYHKQCFELEQSESAQTVEPEQRHQLPESSQSPSPRPGLYAETDPSLDGRGGARGGERPATPSRQSGASSSSSTRLLSSQSQTNLDSHPGSPSVDSNHQNQSMPARAPGGRQQDRQQASPASPSPSAMNGRSRPMRHQHQHQHQSADQRAATLPNSVSANGLSDHQTYPRSSRTLDGRRQAGPATGQGHGRSQQNGVSATTSCAGCKQRIIDGQALIALDQHWHVWCFKCAQCQAPLHGEYVAKEGRAYCERDYQKLFGISCVYCKRYITGKVLQAGEAHHFHPSCARCSKCGDPFVPGEEMYLQGEVTWHPRCGPGPSGAESGLLEGAGDESQLRARSPSLSEQSRSRSASPFSYMSRQYGRASPAYAESEAVGDLSRVYTISYLNADPNQGYLRRPIEPSAPKSPQFSRPTSLSRLGPSDRSRCSSRSQQCVYGSSASGLGGARERSVPRGMYSLLSGMRGADSSSARARSPSMMNEEPIQLAAYPSGQRPAPDAVAKIERDDFPAPPFPYPERQHQQHHQQQQQQQRTSARRLEAQPEGAAGAPEHQERASRPRSREVAGEQQQRARHKRHQADLVDDRLDSDSSTEGLDARSSREEQELSKIANGIGKIFLQTLKERERLQAWKRANLDPRNASRTPSATRELPSRLRYENPANASPSRDIDRVRPVLDEDCSELPAPGEHSPTRTRSSLGRSQGAAASASALSSAPSYGYKVVQSSRSTPRPGYGLTAGPYGARAPGEPGAWSVSFAEQQRIAQARANDLLGRQAATAAAAANGTNSLVQQHQPVGSELGALAAGKLPNLISSGSTRSFASSSAHLRRSMPNVAQLRHLHQEGPPKLYPYHLLSTANYRLPQDVDRCHLERHLSNEEFRYIFHCDRLDFYRLPEWKRNELKRRARLF